MDDVLYFISGVMNCSSIPGASFSLVQNGQTLMAKGYGFTNVETGEQVNSKTKFCIASCSKAFNSALLAKVLTTASNVTWDTPAREIFGDWFYLNTGYMSNKTSLRDLLAHKTGVPRHDMVWLLNVFAREELVRRMRFFRPIPPFRTSFVYNNNMHTTAGEIVRVLRGEAWDDVLQEFLLDPLGMSDTVVYHKAAPSWTGFAKPYISDGAGTFIDVPYESLIGGGSLAAAAAGVSSTADDMAKWLKFHLSGGKNENGSQVVDSDVLERTKQGENVILPSPLTIRPINNVTDVVDQYALSWMSGFYRGYRKLSHSGSWLYTSLVTYLPDMDVGTFISFNVLTPSVTRNMIHAYVLDVALGLEPWLDVDQVCNLTNRQHGVPENELDETDGRLFKLTKKAHRIFKANRPLEEYVGTYGNYGYGNMTVSLNSGGPEPSLELSYGNIGRFNLIPSGVDDEFIPEGVGAASIFNIGPLQFQSSNNQTFDQVQTIFELTDPPIFERDLKLENAPSPPNNNC